MNVAAEIRRRADAFKRTRDSGLRLDGIMTAGDPALRVCTCIDQPTCSCSAARIDRQTARARFLDLQANAHRERYDHAAHTPSGLGACGECGITTDGRGSLCEHCQELRDAGALSANETRARFLADQRQAHKRKVSR